MIYDCFTFFNELDLLEIRMNTLNDVVDFFVLVEANKTFTNKEKNYIFESNKEHYSKFYHKIIHIKVDDFPPFTGNPWEFEYFQRNAIQRGLKNCRSNDQIIISDIDEIPSPEAIKKCNDVSTNYFFRQNFYSFFLNMQDNNERYWYGSIMIPYRNLTTPEGIRLCRLHFKKKHYYCVLKKLFYFITFNRSRYRKWSTASKGQMKNSTEVEYGGWHFSYLGGTEKIILKLQSFSHQEYITTENTDPALIERNIANKNFRFGMKDSRLEKVLIDESFPLPIRNNPDKYKHLIAPDFL